MWSGVKRRLGSVFGSFRFPSIYDLGVELHIPGYQFCGPGTKYEERIARGDRGINRLDEACREHDRVYTEYQEPSQEGKRKRLESDEVLIRRAKEIRQDPQTAWQERLSSYAVEAGLRFKHVFGVF
jgi:hypothetical protein